MMILLAMLRAAISTVALSHVFARQPNMSVALFCPK